MGNILRIIGMAFWLLIFSAQLSWSNGNSQVSWEYYTTEHFKILFHKDVKPQAEVAKVFLEQAYTKISHDLGYRDQGIQITVVLTGLPDESNGLSTPLGHHIEIFTRPMQMMAAPEIGWLKRVLAHELTHQITFLCLRKSFWGIYSELYKTSYMPAWFVEGIAQYESESWDAKRNTFFAHAVFNSAIEPYPNLATYVKQDPIYGRLVYEQGHAFVKYLVAREGPDFLKYLLRRISVIPFWTELKAILSPLTQNYLPLESAIYDLTAKHATYLYASFIDSAQAKWTKKPHGIVNLDRDSLFNSRQILGPDSGFAMVFENKIAENGTVYFTAQEKIDQPFISLYQSRHGFVSKIDPGFVNPVFDLSPSKNQILFVTTYQNKYQEPVEKLFLKNLQTGRTIFLSDGAAHPIFLTEDSIAFSHYQFGRQSLTICGIDNSSGLKVGCQEAKADSLSGFYALSRSTNGILCNATDTAGRTGVYEFTATSGFTRILSDTVTAEFPVEGKDGLIYLLKEKNNLLQVQSFDREKNIFIASSNYALGTFYLHANGAGELASVVQLKSNLGLGDQESWHLRPIKPVVTPMNSSFDSTADSAKALSISQPKSSLPNFESDSTAGSREYLAAAAKLSSYNSFTGIRPLLAYPTVASSYPSIGLGGGMYLQDPLEQHTVSFAAASINTGFGYNVAYANQQTPVTVTVTSSNLAEIITRLGSEADSAVILSTSAPSNWTKVDLVERNLENSLRIQIPIPWDLPLPHQLEFGLRGFYNIRSFKLGGAKKSVDTSKVPKLELLDAWSLERKEMGGQGYFAYSYLRPYAYNYVHPLLYTNLAAGVYQKFPYTTNAVYVYGRQTIPWYKELTQTFWYQGALINSELSLRVATLPDGQTTSIIFGNGQKIIQDFYTSLEFPIVKGYVTELPLLGLINYVGGSIFGGIGEDAQNQSNYFQTRIEPRKTVGAKIIALFHPLRRIPLVLSQSAQFDLEAKSMKYRLKLEVAGLPSNYSIRPQLIY